MHFDKKLYFIIIVSFIILAGVITFIVWKLCYDPSEQRPFGESKSHINPIFLHPDHLLFAKENGHLNMNSFLPFFHYVAEDLRPDREDPWKVKYINILWTMEDCNRVFIRHFGSEKLTDTLAKLIPIMSFGGVYQVSGEPLDGKYKKGIEEHLLNSNGTKVILFRDSNDKIKDRFFASTYAPEFWKIIISNILSSRKENNYMEEIYLEAKKDKGIDLVIL